MKKQMTELESEEFLHAASTGHLASSSISGDNLRYALTRLSKLTAKSHHFMPGGEQHSRNIAVWGKARDGMRIMPRKN